MVGPAASLARSSLYEYASADGTVLYQAVRYAPKGFSQRRPDGNGGWIPKGPEPGHAVPYRLPELLASDIAPVLIAGGEKDVENLRALGFTATCNHGGEGKWWPELTQYFEGMRVFILCDNDAQGEKHQQIVGAALHGVAKEIRVVRFPELPAGGDVSDLIEAGATKQDLAKRFQHAAEWEAPETVRIETEEVFFATPTGGAERPIILVERGHLHRLATRGEQALVKANVDFYSRGGTLVRPAIDEVDASKGRKTKSARLLEVSPEGMVDYLSRYVRWERYDTRSKTTLPADPPKEVARIILDRDGEWKGFRPLAGVITAPTMRPDGSIFSEPGYDPATRLVLFAPPRMPALKQKPTREDALAALKLLEDLLFEFPFVDEASRSVGLSGLMTSACRGALGVAPLHALRAPAPGSGKSYLVDLISVMVNGRPCPVIAAGRTEEETEKRLGAALLQGYPVISIDNLNGVLGGDSLCQLISQRIVSVRPLGSSVLRQIEAGATVFATGNNIQPTGDVIRRVVLCSLDPNMERPEQRQFRGDPIAMVSADRGKYIAACMTVVSAWLNSGEPDPVPPLASFEEWSHTIRSALIWLGKEDPVLTMETAREEDSELEMLRAFVAAWKQAAGLNNHLLSGELKTLAEEAEVTTGGEYFDRHDKKFVHPDFRQALLDIASKGGEIDAVRIGRYLGRYHNRVVDGIKIMGAEDSDKKHKKWWLKAL
jgi:putative DNA primase/helicase